MKDTRMFGILSYDHPLTEAAREQIRTELEGYGRGRVLIIPSHMTFKPWEVVGGPTYPTAKEVSRPSLIKRISGLVKRIGDWMQAGS